MAPVFSETPRNQQNSCVGYKNAEATTKTNVKDDKGDS